MIGSGRRGFWRIDQAGLVTCRFVPAGFRTSHSRRTAARVLVRMFAATLRSRWQGMTGTSSHNLGSNQLMMFATMHEGGGPKYRKSTPTPGPIFTSAAPR